jgi:hypothetical protein
MPMQAESLEVLEKADVAPAQARAIVRAIEIELSGARDVLATKHDLVELGASLRGEMSQLRAELRGEISDRHAQSRTELAALRTDMAAWRGELKAEIHAVVGNSTRQMYMALLGQMAVLLGFAYFFATHVR